MLRQLPAAISFCAPVKGYSTAIDITPRED